MAMEDSSGMEEGGGKAECRRGRLFFFTREDRMGWNGDRSGLGRGVDPALDPNCQLKSE